MPGRPSVEVLLFDLGGVLVDFSGFEELAVLLQDKPTRTAIQKKWIHSNAIGRFESGEISAESFARIFVTEWRLSLTPKEFLHRFSGWSQGLFPGTTRLLRRLQETHRIACLSNSNEIHGPSQRRWLGGLVEMFFFSYEMGLVKPDPAVFEQAIRRLEVPASRIAYFDDTLVNTQAAGEAGMKAFRVAGLAELKDALSQLGIVTD